MTWKTPTHIKNLLDKYYMQYYNMTHEEFIYEFGEADFAHDERLVVFTLSKCKEVFEK